MKQQLSEVKGFLNQLETSGLTYNDMVEDFGLTKWGARKVGEHEAVQVEERVGNHAKLFYTENTDQLRSFTVPVQERGADHEEERRQTREAKQTVTNKANTYLAELEAEVKNTETPETRFQQPSHTSDGYTAIIHETDPHFSAEVTNRFGDTVYNTEIAKQQTEEAFYWYLKKLSGEGLDRLDNVVLLLGGDLVEGEDIYDGQPHNIENGLKQQIDAARKTYYRQIKRLRKATGVPVKVVCVSGNHGDLGKESGANADDIIYSMIEDMINLSQVEDVKFVYSERSDYNTFTFRSHQGYLTHGENRKEHLGTASGKRDWLAIKDETGFDAAWRGHYHMQKREPVNGAPVIMTNSRKPGDDYTESIATFGSPGIALYISTDEQPVAKTYTQNLDLKR